MTKRAIAVVSHVRPEPMDGRAMSSPQALAAFAALGQPTRLEIFRLLMSKEPHGLTAGAIAESLGCLQNTLSSHLAILARAGLITGSRAGRAITYRADIAGLQSLMSFLVTDCCNGHPGLCAFVTDALDAAACEADNACVCDHQEIEGRRWQGEAP